MLRRSADQRLESDYASGRGPGGQRDGDQRGHHAGLFAGNQSARDEYNLAAGWHGRGGPNFYVRGRLNDETATVTAQVVDAGGNTNAAEGIVERNGMFWVENLPLTNGDNIVTVTATDAAGNVTTTNLTVSESDVA